MSAKFKFKPTKNKFATEKTYSLNDIHKEKMNLYYENKKILPVKHKELQKLTEKLKKYEYREKNKIGFNLFMNNGGPYLHFNEITDKYDISIEDNYNDNYTADYNDDNDEYDDDKYSNNQLDDFRLKR